MQICAIDSRRASWGLTKCNFIEIVITLRWCWIWIFSLAESGPDPQDHQLDSIETTFPGLSDDELRTAFRDCMHLTPWQEEHMRETKHADHHFARQYPFLYARKYKVYFRLHFLQGLVWAYGRFGLHICFLVAVSVAIVGGYRSAHLCASMEGSSSTFSFLAWPRICNNYLLATIGVCQYISDDHPEHWISAKIIDSTHIVTGIQLMVYFEWNWVYLAFCKSKGI